MLRGDFFFWDTFYIPKLMNRDRAIFFGLNKVFKKQCFSLDKGRRHNLKTGKFGDNVPSRGTGEGGQDS